MAKKEFPFPRDPVIEAYKKDLDYTLIEENRKRTVQERFERLMELQRFAEELQRAGREAGKEEQRLFLRSFAPVQKMERSASLLGRPEDLETLAELESMLEHEW